MFSLTRAKIKEYVIINIKSVKPNKNISKRLAYTKKKIYRNKTTNLRENLEEGGRPILGINRNRNHPQNKPKEG